MRDFATGTDFGKQGQATRVAYPCLVVPEGTVVFKVSDIEAFLADRSVAERRVRTSNQVNTEAQRQATFRARLSATRTWAATDVSFYPIDSMSTVTADESRRGSDY